MTRSGIACGVLCLIVSTAALAGQRPFLWAYDTTIVSTGNAELEQWLWVSGSVPPTATTPALAAGYWLWWSPVVGITRHLEAAVPFQVLATRGFTQLTSVDPDLRWRLFPQDDRGGFQALLRTALHQTPSGESRFDFNVSGSHGGPTELRVLAEVGAQLPFIQSASFTDHRRLTGDLGLAYPFLQGELFASAELYSVLELQPSPVASVGMSGEVAWTSGRFWATLGMLVGLTSPTENVPRFMPRLIWGVAF